MAKRLDGKKVATGIAIAAALYYLWGIASDSFDGSDAPDLTTDGPEVAALGQEDTGFDPSLTPMPEMPAPTPAPEAAPAPTPQPVPQVAPTPQQASPLVAPVQAPAPTGNTMGNDPANTGIMSWYKNLSPGAQQALAGGVAGGASGLMAALAQRSAQEDAKEREDRARDDKIRRGSIPAFGQGFLSRAKGG